MSKKRIGYLAVAAFGLFFTLLLGYEFAASVLSEGGPVYESWKHGVVARGAAAVFMHAAMVALAALITGYGIRGAVKS